MHKSGQCRIWTRIWESLLERLGVRFRARKLKTAPKLYHCTQLRTYHRASVRNFFPIPLDVIWNAFLCLIYPNKQGWKSSFFLLNIPIMIHWFLGSSYKHRIRSRGLIYLEGMRQKNARLHRVKNKQKCHGVNLISIVSKFFFSVKRNKLQFCNQLR